MTVITLQAGEALVTVAAGDTVQWIVGDTASGSGASRRVDVMVKPVRVGITTNLVITTSRRTYLLELTSTAKAWMASVSWQYPKDQMLALQAQAQAADAQAPAASGLSLDQLHFRYAITGDNPPWKPVRAFDDGQHVYIQFPSGIAQGELPPLFVVGPDGKGELVNYRFHAPYDIVDRCSARPSCAWVERRPPWCASSASTASRREQIMSATDRDTPPAPKVAPEGVTLRASPRPVTRLNRRTLAVSATLLAVAVAGASMWALQSKGRRGSGDQTNLYNVDRVAKADDFDQLPADYSKLPAKPAPAPAASVPQLGPPLPSDWGAASVAPLPAGGGNPGPSAESIDRQRQAEEVARSAMFFRTSSTTGKPDAALMPAVAAPSVNASAGPFHPMGAGPASTAAQPNDPTAIQNRQDQKEAFLAKGGAAATSNMGSLQAPVSPYTVMAGTIIPAALVTGINSDLPGQIIAEVTQPVYDTATGHYLLIPQGSRLIGRYDSQVAFGQRRVLLVWLRLVLPDTSSIALDKLPGIDPAGYAGVEDAVDWHGGRLLAGAALSTLLGVSSELAVSNQGDINGNTVLALRDSAQDTANQIGQEITRRNLSIQPTLTVRPGFPLDVMVDKDLVLRPYQPLFTQRGPMP